MFMIVLRISGLDVQHITFSVFHVFLVKKFVGYCQYVYFFIFTLLCSW